MTTGSYLDLASIIFNEVSAPLYEKKIRNRIKQLASLWKRVKVSEDRWGNLLLRYSYRPKKVQSLFFVGHLDHPGFEIMKGNAYLRGGVEREYLKGSNVLIYGNDYQFLTRATIQEVISEKEGERLILNQTPHDGAFGVWDLPAFKKQGNWVKGRACDDLVAIVSMMSLIRYLSENEIPANVECWMTRAEEVGFWGTFGRIRESQKKYSNRIGISIEASRAQGFAPCGKGMVIRLGDRSSLFDSAVTRWMTVHAETLQKESSSFAFQKCWMGGGTCEATPLQEAGFRMGAICLPLQNYHNQGPRGKLKPEAVHQADWESMLALMLRMTTSPVTVSVIQKQFSSRLKTRSQEATRRL